MDIITPLNVPVCMWGRYCRSKYFCWVKINLVFKPSNISLAFNFSISL